MFVWRKKNLSVICSISLYLPITMKTRVRSTTQQAANYPKILSQKIQRNHQRISTQTSIFEGTHLRLLSTLPGLQFLMSHNTTNGSSSSDKLGAAGLPLLPMLISTWFLLPEHLKLISFSKSDFQRRRPIQLLPKALCWNNIPPQALNLNWRTATYRYFIWILIYFS